MSKSSPPAAAVAAGARTADQKFEWARAALESTCKAAGPNAKDAGLLSPTGWRWRVLADLEELSGFVVKGYTTARDRQASQAWESRLGPIATGTGAGIGAVISAVTAGLVKPGGWGWLVVIPGVLVAIAGSVFSATSYVRSRHMKLRYLRLMHDIGDYAYIVLPTAAPADVVQQTDVFRQLWESAGT